MLDSIMGVVGVALGSTSVGSVITWFTIRHKQKEETKGVSIANEQAISELTAKIRADLLEEVQGLVDKVLELRNDNIQLTEDKAVLMADLNDQKRKNAIYKQENAEFRKQNDDLVKKVEGLERKIQTLSNKVNKLGCVKDDCTQRVSNGLNEKSVDDENK